MTGRNEKSALQKFLDSLDDINLLYDLSKRYFSIFDDEASLSADARKEADEQVAIARQSDPTNEALIEELESAFAMASTAATRDREEARLWRRETYRRVAVGCVTVLEVFLHDFLAEQIRSQPSLVEKLIQKEWGLSVVVRTGATREGTRRYANKICTNFQNSEMVTKAYMSILGKNPFRWHDGSNVFKKENEMDSALRDVRLVICLRHNLIHANGGGGAGLGDEIVKKLGAGWPSTILDQSLAAGYGERDSTPAPDDILTSARRGTPYDCKAEEFLASVKHFGIYVSQVCVPSTAISPDLENEPTVAG